MDWIQVFAIIGSNIALFGLGIQIFNKRIDDTNANLGRRIDETNRNLGKRIDDSNANLSKRIDDLKPQSLRSARS